MDRVDRIKGNANQNRNWHRNRNRNTKTIELNCVYLFTQFDFLQRSVGSHDLLKFFHLGLPLSLFPLSSSLFCCSGFGFAVFTNQFAGIFLAYSFRGKIDYAAFPIFQTNWHTRTRCACAYVCVCVCVCLRVPDTHTHTHAPTPRDSSMYYTLNILKQIELRKFENLFCFSLWFSSKLYNVAAAIDLP